MTDARNGRWSAFAAAGGESCRTPASASHASPAGGGGIGGVARAVVTGNVARPPPMYSAAAAAHRADGEEQLCSPRGCATLDVRKKKLSKSKLMLPLSRERRNSGDLSSSSASSTNGLKLMSPADERMIDEAIQLANQFARTSLHSQEQDGDPGSCAKSRNKFHLKFPLKKASPQIEKKSFTDGLAMKATTAVAQLLTPESEAAYYELVAKGSLQASSPSSSLAWSVASSAATTPTSSGTLSRQPYATRSQTGSDHQILAVPQLPIDVPSTAGRSRMIRRSSSPAMATVVSQQQHGIQAPPPVQLVDSQIHESSRHQSAPKPVLRKSMSVADDRHPGSRQSWASTKARPRHLDIVCDYGGLCAKPDDDDEGIMADDLSDLPSSPPPPPPPLSSNAYVGIGLYNNLDPFWRHEMRLDFEADEEITSMQGRYKTRSEDNVSYEELLEFAPMVTAHDRDVIRVMQKVLGREVTESECQRALRETHGDALNAIKFVKLMQLWRLLQANGFTGASVAQCKEALMYCNWDVGYAAKHVTGNGGPGRDGSSAAAVSRHGDWRGHSNDCNVASAGTSAAVTPGTHELPRQAAHRVLSCPLAWSGT